MQTPQSPHRSSVSETWLIAESDDPDAEAPPELTEDNLIGTTLLGSYTIDRLLGEGGMGLIYEAHHTRIAEKRFAIKVLRPEFVHSTTTRARFEREANAVARISHPGVLTIVDVGTTPLGLPYMVCEHLNGLDLLAYLRRFGALPNERVVHLGCRVAEALEATHANGVIHRDVKPSNIFLLGAFAPLGPEWDRVKLIDFGLSRFVSRDDQLTKTGVVMGTPAYMAPEQARGGRADQLTDVYGVGAVLYAAATGVPPFPEGTQQETLLAVLSRDPIRPIELNRSLSEGLEAVIQRAMSKRPEDRYPSMSALRLELANLELGSAPVASGARGHGPGDAIGVRSRFLGLGAAAVLLGLGAIVSIVSGLSALSGEVRLSTPERRLLVAALGAVVVLSLLGLRRVTRRIWGNTAQVVDRLPRLRSPVLTALVVYGLCSFALRFAHEVLAPVSLGKALEDAPGAAWPGWSALLASVALCTASLVAVHENWWQPMRPARRWAWGAALAAVTLLGALAFTRREALGRAAAHARAEVAARSAPEAPAAPALPKAPRAAQVAPPAPTEIVTYEVSALAPLPPDPPLGTTVSEAPKDQSLPAAPAAGSKEEDAVVVSEASEHSEPSVAPEHAAPPSTADGDGDDQVRARIRARANRPAELGDAVQGIEQLFRNSPASIHDAELRRILIKAAGVDGEVSKAAFHVMSVEMGTEGPDLLYDLMLRRPSLSERAKFKLTRFRTRKLFSPELSIAYELRFAPSCVARVSLLPRANEVGDQRTINVLASLSSNPKQCGTPGHPPCQEFCEQQSALFSRSIETIVRRLRASAELPRGAGPS